MFLLIIPNNLANLWVLNHFFLPRFGVFTNKTAEISFTFLNHLFYRCKPLKNISGAYCFLHPEYNFQFWYAEYCCFDLINHCLSTWHLTGTFLINFPNTHIPKDIILVVTRRKARCFGFFGVCLNAANDKFCKSQWPHPRPLSKREGWQRLQDYWLKMSLKIAWIIFLLWVFSGCLNATNDKFCKTRCGLTPGPSPKERGDKDCKIIG